MKSRHAWGLVFFVTVTSGSLLGLDAYAQDRRATGAIIPTREEEEAIHKRDKIKTVKSVEPNALGRGRINRELRKEGKPLLPSRSAKPLGEETVAIEEDVASAPEMTYSMTALPPAVDNSVLPSFPPIGNQGSIGSCVPWAVGYYAHTHNTGLQLGWNNKTSSANWCSPSFLMDNKYHALGIASACNGSGLASIYELVDRHGCVTVARYPIKTVNTADACLGVETSAADWKSAIPYRIAPYERVAVEANIVDTMSEEEKDAIYLANLAPIKATLNNGYVIPITVNIDSGFYGVTVQPAGTWSSTAAVPVQPHPAGGGQAFAGQWALGTAGGFAGSHAITLVGYDERAWVDANRNGLVDSGEVGVFKIANSWGTSWGNAGYILVTNRWLRNQAGYYFYLMKTRVNNGVPYQPKVLAEINIDLLQSDTTFQFGTSSTSATSPTAIFSLFTSLSQAYAYTSASTPNVGMTVDLTDILQSTSDGVNRFYATIGDTVSGNASQLNSFSITNVAAGTVKSTSTRMPLSVDLGTARATVDVAVGASPAPVVSTSPSPPPAPVVSPSPSPSPSPTATGKPCRGKRC